MDVIHSVYGFFPLMIAATIATAMVFMAASFQSLVVPFRSLVSNLLTLVFVYGMTVLVYEYGILDWTGWPAVQKLPEGLSFTLPVIIFFVIIGICLDYDIFLLTRVTEYRADGFGPRESIEKGLVATGGIITAAGVIMAIAFGGLLFSKVGQLNIIGFMMSLATLYDTFIARSVVNPAVMSLIGRHNWFPSKLSKQGYTPPEESARIVSLQGYSRHV